MPELVWPGKYKTESIHAKLEVGRMVYPGGVGNLAEHPESRLFLGDNLPVMAGLLPDYEGRLSLIYADPPFFTNRKFQARVGRGEDSRKPQDWQLAEGYPDSWPNLEAYLDMLYPRLRMMHRLLAPGGTLYLHLDWHADGYARVLLDEIFGEDRLLNEVIWVYHGPSPIRRAFNRKHDTILVYTKGESYTFNVDAVRQPYDPNTVKTFASSKKAGFGKVPDLERGKVPEDWWYFPVVARLHGERTGYPTQKPEALLERIILASSNPGDWVADFFCGSGTFPLVAARSGRRFLASDATWRAIHTTQTRLIAGGSPPFLEGHIAGNLRPIRDYPGSVFLDGLTITLPEDPQLPELEYWEVDPEWDGVIFRSRFQVFRQKKETTITRMLDLPESAVNGKLCVRMVTGDGQIYQKELVL